MTWREELQPASFRGIEFFVETADTDFGRRNVIHEYPYKNTPYTEDLGRKAREINVRAYVIGDDQFEQQQRLIKAIEQDSRPGTLVHPSLGPILVVPKGCSHGYNNREGGITYFDLSFTEAGENQFPDQKVDTQQKILLAAQDGKQSILSAFSTTFTVGGMPEFAKTSAAAISEGMTIRMEKAMALKAAIPTEFSTFNADLSDFKSNIPALVSQPQNLAGQLIDLVSRIRTLYNSPKDSFTVFRDMQGFGNDIQPIAPTTSTRIKEANNQKSLIRLFRLSSLVGMSETVSEIEFDSYNSAVSIRDEVASYLDDEIIQLGSTDEDDLFFQMETLRAAVVNDVTQRAANLQRIKYIQPQTPMPALVASYELYGTADRADEIVTRNRVRHPGFLPANQELQILVS